LNPGLRIIARAEHRSSEKKLKQAGADRVVMPAVIGAQRMARMLVRPATAEVIELFGDAGEMQMEMDELTIDEQSSLVGKTVAEAETHRLHRLLIVMVKQVDGKMVFNPSADYLFRALDTLVVMGRLEDISRFQQEYSI
jgi:voltage-gated potassium channel